MKNNLVRRLKTLLRPLAKTIFHPQWLSYRMPALKRDLADIQSGSALLDIGCHDRWPEKYVKDPKIYVGLDYPALQVAGYKSTVDVWGDGHNLPFPDRSFDVVLLLDVLEHVRNADLVVCEIERVLKPEGNLILQIPFLYPVHDYPHDYRRYTEEGLRRLLEDGGFEVTAVTSRGSPIETACLLLNISVSDFFVSVLSGRASVVFLVLLPLLPLLVVFNNLLGFFASGVGNNMMPFSYNLVAYKLSN